MLQTDRQRGKDTSRKREILREEDWRERERESERERERERERGGEREREN